MASYKVKEVTEQDRKKRGWNIEGPFYIVDEENTVRAEGVCCKRHAQIMADALHGAESNSFSDIKARARNPQSVLRSLMKRDPQGAIDYIIKAVQRGART